MPQKIALPPDVKTVMFLNVPFACLDVAGAAALIAARPPGAPFAYVVTPNAANLTRINELKDPVFIEIYENAWLHTMDGAVPRALARQLFGLDIPRTPGSDLTEALFEHHIKPDDAITIIGGSDEMLERLKARYHLTNVAMWVPPMGFIDKPDEVERCVRFVLDHPARYLFFVTGSPRSEYVTRLVWQRGTAVGTGLCVGNSLNFLTGLSTRAPLIYRRLGVEWLHRLVTDPKIQVKRIFVDSLPVLLAAAKARLNPAAYGMATPDKTAP
ncbi:WecB/TagA/CpsF family glycosyltransferase [Xanthobacter agilis]|jgi:exopolysaccharide biosynthesis WecB/TagA/CpsF family protein|uniref:Exopolysaccharide biosynthesis WecB/TagA/CpsF family protein n=1 Tax=Xanthobacter agilis TaxID=47492 RepID=A0ABU0L8C0_XANAG|nr:WecB/TagA/CpsF family glycosyltransferase [Xanthobacter agilis]MDQ0503393.1 exopolysaccharide biosynthesis WecB/TagA/CpsF family protein [Xanthobacter agilis]